jgi:hypothetical protein
MEQATLNFVTLAMQAVHYAKHVHWLPASPAGMCGIAFCFG